MSLTQALQVRSNADVSGRDSAPDVKAQLFLAGSEGCDWTLYALVYGP
jgi:hypothetical protein